MAVGLTKRGRPTSLPSIFVFVLISLTFLSTWGRNHMRPKKEVFASLVMQSVAAEEKKAQAFSERFSDAACSKSWLFRRVCSGLLLSSLFVIEADAGAALPDSVAPDAALLWSNSPILLVASNSFCIREGA